MRIVILGCGYVGLVTGTCLAHIGHEVVCVDTDVARISALAAGEVPIYEKGLKALVAANVAQGRLSFALVLPELDSSIDAIFIAVGTPAGGDGKSADLSALAGAVEDIAQAASASPLIVVKSTVPMGVCDAIETMMGRLRPDLSAEVVSNPEFLKEGRAVLDFLGPDRIVIGTDDGAPNPVLEAIYAPLAEAGVPIHWTGRRSSELIKHASNAFLATKVAFINEVADLCEKGGADIRSVARGMGLDARIGPAFLEAGPGYGGSCFPKDGVALLETAQTYGVRLGILERTVASNLQRRGGLASRVVEAMDGSVDGKRIGVLGLAFKAGTDDCRESPAVDLIGDLIALGARVVACDPKAMPYGHPALNSLALALDPYDCAQGCDCLVLATAWPQFSRLDPFRLAQMMTGRTIVDLRNGLDVTGFATAGFAIHGVGRRPDSAHRPATRSPAWHAAGEPQLSAAQ
ncbi:UDP-glucose dehydrogenase family protein [Pelagibacterium lacus]|uniref:UDP-glucose 6-dehydrogenase n=1 Tax=Pelagibacterium lacus TaxID=2282655 RepID=A0A369W5N1_9HYPH|nr:UDP-glucose/GDP-mannose dehydrogenase family protein [Pelagibacterium lacus]RDE09165.1 UDP-glucose/GDP-mannose dehydrogenase family protein [Pelagibacterium lacus]